MNNLFGRIQQIKSMWQRIINLYFINVGGFIWPRFLLTTKYRIVPRHRVGASQRNIRTVGSTCCNMLYEGFSVWIGRWRPCRKTDSAGIMGMPMRTDPRAFIECSHNLLSESLQTREIPNKQHYNTNAKKYQIVTDKRNQKETLSQNN